MSFSAPSAINVEHTVVKFDTDNPEQCYLVEDHENSQENFDSSNGQNMGVVTATTDSSDRQDHDTGDQDVELIKEQHDWQSLSCLTDSTEHSAPVNFDMSNRAKLPRGIDKIRPHIELIDNVPLLVSLFTDCTATSTREMLRIMQDYGEVVCVMGSSANCENMGIFLQADASIAIEPVYPQICQKQPTYKNIDTGNNFMSPIDLSRRLNSVACSISIKREDTLSLHYLIMEARHYVSALWNTTQFWMCSCVTVTLLQFIASLCMLPTILTPGHVLWIICVIIPFLSVSLIGVGKDPDIMKRPQPKNHITLNTETVSLVLWYYGMKFLPLIVIVIICFIGLLSGECISICAIQNCTCILFYLPIEKQNLTSFGGWIDAEHSLTLRSAQNYVVILIFLHFAAISISFVYREHNVWSKSPHENFLWLLIIFILFILQSIYSLINFIEMNYDTKYDFQIGISVLVFGILSPLLTFGINEIIKRNEIKSNLRQQRRARLEFGTKLGMNSPF